MKLTDEDKKQICIKSKTIRASELSKIYNVSDSYISYILKKYNIIYDLKNFKTRTKVDIDYFEEINSPDKAYWLGYICADGNISKTLNTITLTSKDFEILQKYQKSIKGEYSIEKNNSFHKKTNKYYINYMYRISNKKLKNDLAILGVTSDKTNKLEMPKIDEKYYSYFFAGLFDGDGCISFEKNGNIRISLISTKQVLDFLQNYLTINLEINSKKMYQVKCSKSNIFIMKLYKDSLKFLNWIYQDPSFSYMERKFKKFKEFKEKRIRELNLELNYLNG
jgi:hypothetical protein